MTLCYTYPFICSQRGKKRIIRRFRLTSSSKAAKRSASKSALNPNQSKHPTKHKVSLPKRADTDHMLPPSTFKNPHQTSSTDVDKTRTSLLEAQLAEQPTPIEQSEDSSAPLNIHQHLIDIIESTPFSELRHVVEEHDVFRLLRSVYPYIPNETELLSMPGYGKSELVQRVARLFAVELELKIQMILSAEWYRSDYAKHRQINDKLLHSSHYYPTSHSSQTSSWITPPSLLRFLKSSPVGRSGALSLFASIHQQLDFIGQHSMRNNVGSDDTSAKRIETFLHSVCDACT